MSGNSEYGALTEAVYYILLSLHKPMHGYGIMQNVKDLTGGRMSLGAGTLYGAINTLLQKEWIEPTDSDEKSRKKEYVITDLGQQAVDAEIQRLREMLKNGEEITGGRKK